MGAHGRLRVTGQLVSHSKLGVVGAGQLARMMHQAAIALAIELDVLAVSADEPAPLAGVPAQFGEATDPEALRRFSASHDVVTFDHEVVDLETALALEAEGRVLRPSAAALGVVADKSVMRRTLHDAGLPVPDFVIANDEAEVTAALGRWPQAVLKLTRGGYDGRGVFMVASVDEAMAVAGPVFAGGGRFVIEPLLHLDAEMAVIVARRPGGESVVYDPVTTVQVDGMCSEVIAPAQVSAQHRAAATDLVARIADELDVVGLLAVELFLVGEEITINELAVRPHNTGHHTIDACVTSQFENHLRAVLDLPLGEPSLTAAHAVMVNVVGGEALRDPRDLLPDALAVDPGAHVHLYAKEPRPGRKVGHVTICDENLERARRRAWAVTTALDTPKEPS
ncbi:MAG: 5-(carboxyamino)imidazole ribonucleotide synthase [Actinomycetia bacterium]|nr:5-(carboxyamino)imidazole ribonucleotide synthase [Actinomycetes bacterium]